MLVILPNKRFAKLQCTRTVYKQTKEEINEKNFTTNSGYSSSLIIQKYLPTKKKIYLNVSSTFQRRHTYIQINVVLIQALLFYASRTENSDSLKE